MEGSQQFNLRWNNHTNNILQVFLEHLSCELLVDVTLSCQGQFIKAHRMILSACSPYFQELFKHHSAKHPVIILNGMKYEDLQMMIKFMYHGEIRVQEAQLDDLLAAAEMLQVKGLSNVRNKYEKGEIQSHDIEKSSTMTSKKEATANAVATMANSLQAAAQRSRKTDAPPDLPRIRKRRKMSHTIVRTKNELAKETVFTSNGAVCLEPEGPSTKCGTEIEWSSSIKVETPNIRDINKEDERNHSSSSEAKILRLKGKKKSGGQKAIVITDKTQVPGKIPRPPNAFMIFANEWRRKLAFEYPNESNTEISVRLGIMWKGLNVEDKEKYYVLAKKVDEEHKRKYPGYYYSPKEARLRKNLKQDLMLARCLPTNIRDVDALRLVKVFMNVDEHQSNVVRATADGENADVDVDDPRATIKQSKKKQSDEEDKDTVSLTSVTT